jgi:hypothetical protein
MPIEEQKVCQGLYSTGMIIVYNLIMAVAIFLLWPIWVPVVRTRNKHRDTFFKRLFMQALSPIGPESPVARRPIWIHALSVGEVLSAESLVKALAQKHGPRALVFTASTQTGVEMATRLIAPHVSAVRYFPYDPLFREPGAACHSTAPGGDRGNRHLAELPLPVKKVPDSRPSGQRPAFGAVLSRLPACRLADGAATVGVWPDLRSDGFRSATFPDPWCS